MNQDAITLLPTVVAIASIIGAAAVATALSHRPLSRAIGERLAARESSIAEFASTATRLDMRGHARGRQFDRYADRVESQSRRYGMLWWLVAPAAALLPMPSPWPLFVAAVLVLTVPCAARLTAYAVLQREGNVRHRRLDKLLADGPSRMARFHASIRQSLANDGVPVPKGGASLAAVQSRSG